MNLRNTSRASHHGRVLLAALVVVGVIACGQDAPSSATSSVAPLATSTPALSPEQLGELGAEIRKNPATADEVLARHQFTRETFEQAIRNVTEDAEASKRYAAAYRRATT